MAQARKLRGVLIRFCASVIQLLRFHPFLSLIFILILYLAFSTASSYYQLNFALAAHSLSLKDLSVDFVQAIEESARNKQPLRYEHSYENTTIPRIIHRTYKTFSIPPKWQRAYNSCVDMNPEFTQYFWTDDSAREFIQDKFPWFLPTYDSYPFTIQRVDALRYFLLWTYGGIYLDLDISCRRPLNSLLKPTSAFFPRTWPYGVSNDVMASTPAHPLIIKAAVSLHDNNKFYVSKYITVFFTTGPMFLNQILTSWFRAVKDSSVSTSDSANPHSVAILPSMFYDRTAYSFFGHLPGSSWHGGDAKFVQWVFNHLVGVSVLVFGLIAPVAVWFWHQSKRRRLKVSRGMYIPMAYSRDTSI